MSGLFELRFYTTRPGKRNDFADLMDRVIIPFNTARGVHVIGSFVDAEDEDTYVWIRRFEDEAHRISAYEAIYQDPEWTAEIGPAVGGLMFRERAVITRALPTAGSPLQ
jgi:quinol monooxygenase YgiN